MQELPRSTCPTKAATQCAPIRETHSYVQRIVNWSGIRHSYTTFNVSKF